MNDNNVNTQKLPVVTRPQCGTRAGHIQHYKKKEEYCDPCKQANREYQAEARKKKWVPFEERVSPTIRPSCGSSRGSDLHAYHGEVSCETCLEAGKERHKNRYSKATPEQKWSRNSKWRVENPELYKASDKKYRDANPEKVAAKNRKRRAWRAGAASEHYTSAEIVEKYGSICHICNEEIDLKAPRHPRYKEGWEKGLHLDHVIALSKGGTDLIENIRPTHVLCNIKKGTK